MSKKPGNEDDKWLEAKRRCRLSDEEVRMAKELGLNPRSLIKNIPSKSQPWKAPVKEWIHDIYAKRFGEARGSKFRQDEMGPSPPPAKTVLDPLDQEDLLPQWDTVNEEEHFVRQSDGMVFSLEEEAGMGDPEAPTLEDDEEMDSFEDFEDDLDLSQGEIDNEEQAMLRRHREFRLAAEAVAAAMSLLPEVEKIVLFGSVAKPLDREVPRFRKFPRAGMEIWHECKDVDLAVWVSRLDRLKALQKARSRAFNDLMASRNIGVAHHQVDVFLMEPGTDRYLGRLCSFGQCPKGKMDCRVEGCGTTRFVRQHTDFALDWASAAAGSVLLYDKEHDAPF